MDEKYKSYYKEFRQQGLSPQQAIIKAHELYIMGEI